jgi:hypothetical protein
MGRKAYGDRSAHPVTRSAARRPWAALTLPQKRLRIQSNVVGGEGWVSPVGDSGLEEVPGRGNPKGKQRRTMSGTETCFQHVTAS